MSMTSEPKNVPFVALRYHDFRLWWIGQLISQSGSAMQTLAINWQISVLTGFNPVALGLVGLSRFIPIVIFSLIGGAVADARNRRKLLIVTQSILALLAAAFGLLTSGGLWVVWPIYAMSALSAATLAFNNPARQALIPALLPREHLANALSVNSVMGQMATIGGALLGGVLIGLYGTSIVYWLNAVSFLAVIGALILMRPAPQESRRRASVGSVREGLRFVFHQPIILSTMLLDFVATFFSSANQLLPIFAAQILNVGAPGLGALTAATSIGSFVAGGSMGFIARVKKPGQVILYSVAVYGLATVLFGLSRDFMISLLMLGVTGAADTVSTILRGTIRQLVTPDELRGRMTSVNMIFFMGGPQLGEMEAGFAAALLGAPLSVITGGIGCLIAVALTAWKAPTLRKFDDEDLKQANSALMAAGK
jgi:MFS family permease